MSWFRKLQYDLKSESEEDETSIWFKKQQYGALNCAEGQIWSPKVWQTERHKKWRR